MDIGLNKEGGGYWEIKVHDTPPPHDDTQQAHMRLSGLREEANMKQGDDVGNTYEHAPLDQHVHDFLHLPLDASSLHGREQINRNRNRQTDRQTNKTARDLGMGTPHENTTHSTDASVLGGHPAKRVGWSPRHGSVAAPTTQGTARVRNWVGHSPPWRSTRPQCAGQGPARQQRTGDHRCQHPPVGRAENEKHSGACVYTRR